ncbi:PREDICTED: HERV-H LTR-associating protein 1 [Galeopterus variegatus]|uniref:HERV-H LTR-associating protein 1 n=1 Tax=Galeopterus variegatus TaxID=482537 RepID=A0ABM0S1Q3_GALVR|nr:PREDICTED: HERV-H LTR-associating protein 1 [Galeopterus variegatus]
MTRFEETYMKSGASVFLTPLPPHLRYSQDLRCWQHRQEVNASGLRGEEKKENGVAFLATTELPARSVDLSTLNLTELMNGMLSRALKDSKKFFSLLSITSYSSFAFHKFSVAIYNISNLKTVDPGKFPTRYCYCLNNRTNDLSDFTALLVDIIGNSTSYLTEIFKSTSILSVSQTNECDCIFICVMTGKSGRNLSDFWEMAEKSPVINYTFTSSMSGVLGAATGRMAGTSEPTTKSRQTLPSISPPHWAQSTHWASALRTSPWTETTHPSEGEETVNPSRIPELPAWTMATQGSTSHTLPASATRRVAGTLWVTANRRTRASTLPIPWAQSTNEKTPGGPPWETRVSTPASAAGAEEATDTKSLWGPPVGMTVVPGSPSQTSPTAGTFTPSTQTSSPTKAPAPKDPHTGNLPAEWPFTPGKEPALVARPQQVSRCPQPLLKEGAMTAVPLTLTIQKLNPCLMELCRFFQQCLCMNHRENPRTEAIRYCLEYYSWFLKNATYICQRVTRVSHSHTLKQKCLENICKSV